jgi:PAS domain S-box-containing protein
MTNQLANDLFLLMLNLSQLQDPERIVQLFTEALNDRLPGVRLGFAPRDQDGGQPGGEALAVATTHHHYGNMTITGGQDLRPETMALLGNAARMLALILENREQGLLLRDEKSQLHEVVDQCTDEVLKANRRLTLEREQRAQAQRALNHSEERLQILFDQAADAIFVCNSGGRLVQVNRKACASTGYSQEELLGLNVSDIDAHYSSPEAMRQVSEALRPGGHLTLETDHRRKDGSLFPVEVTVAQLQTPDGPQIIGIARDISERKRAERKLAELAAIVASSEESIISMDMQGIITNWNRGAESLYGYSAAEAVGRPISMLVPPGHPDLGMGFLQKALAGEKIDQYETARLTKDGRLLELSMTISPMLDESGRQIGISGIARDIGQRKRAEEAQKTSLARQRIAMDLAKLVHWEYDVDADLFSFDDQFYALYGTTAAEQGGTQMSAREYARRFLSPEDAILVKQEVGKALAASDPNYFRQLEHKIIRADGQERIISVRFSVVKDETGRTIKTYGANQDITEVKRAELALEKRLVALIRPLDDVGPIDFNDLFNLEDIQRIQDLFAQATGVASIITAPDGTPITRPSNFCRLCSEIIRQTEAGLRNCYASDAIIGRHHPDGPVVQPCLSGGLWDAGASITVGGKHVGNWLIGQVRNEAQEDEPAMREYARAIGADEERFMAALAEVPTMSREQFERVARLLYALAHQLSAVAFQNVQQARFITEQKQDQEDKARLEGQLRQTLKMEAVGTLAGGIAHDFNNILGAVLGFAEMAREDSLCGKVDPGDLDQIIASAGRAKELVKQIMTFSRKSEPDLMPLNLNQVVQRTQAVLERTLPKMITIETFLAEAPPAVQADPTQMEQVLLNLASNAQDAMPEGGRLIIETQDITLDPAYCHQYLGLEPGHYVLLMVTDTGLGMDKDTQEHIFEPFYTTKEVGRGTGLGLASAYGIVKSHGGHIHCYSQPGSGTSFKIYLPAFLERGAKARQDSISADEDLLHGSEKILLVDDEEALRQFGERTLLRKGYQVLTASSGEQALEIYGQPGQRPDLVIMDLGMPGMGGHKALKAILELDPQAKVVIASGYSAHGQVKASLESGAAGYAAKPFRRAELLTTVRRVLDKE